MLPLEKEKNVVIASIHKSNLIFSRIQDMKQFIKKCHTFQNNFF